jgi:hypothetical protein
MRTTTHTTTPNPTPHTIALLTPTALATVCIWLGPPVYRALQTRGTGVPAIAVVTITALAAVTLPHDLLTDDE